MRRRGFSLLETVLASGLLAAVMLMLFSLYPSSALAIRRSQDHLQADQMALSLLAEQQALPFGLIYTPDAPLSDVVLGPVRYRRSVEVFSVPGADPTLLKGVRATVRWEGVRGPQSVVQETRVVKLEN